MPNWCMNDLRVSGTEAEVLKFIEDNKTDGEFCFKTLVPEPENNEDWYNWRVINWGTKWDIDGNVDVQKVADDCFRLYFTTAWEPPIAWLKSVIKNYPQLSFNLNSCDPGMDWHYVYEGIGGKLELIERGDFAEFASFWGMDPDEFDEDFVEPLELAN